MKGKEENTGKKSESIKDKLNAMTELNKKRKSALEKLSKSILEENKKIENEKHD